MRQCFEKYIRKYGNKKMMTLLLMWLNMSIVTLNIMLQLLVILAFNPRNEQDHFMAKS